MQVKPEKKEDRRVRRTKKLLTHGLIQLMKEKQVQDITVRELADLVDVNRGTFYLYYRDIFDMLDSIEQELFNQVNQLIAAHKGETVLTHTLPVLKELFHLVEENKELCQVLLGQNGDMKFLKKLSDVVQDAFRREWLMMKKDEVTFDYSYAFGALGFVGLLRTWLGRKALCKQLFCGTCCPRASVSSKLLPKQRMEKAYCLLAKLMLIATGNFHGGGSPEGAVAQTWTFDSPLWAFFGYFLSQQKVTESLPQKRLKPRKKSSLLLKSRKTHPQFHPIFRQQPTKSPSAACICRASVL